MELKDWLNNIIRIYQTNHVFKFLNTPIKTKIFIKKKFCFILASFGLDSNYSIFVDYIHNFKNNFDHLIIGFVKNLNYSQYPREKFVKEKVRMKLQQLNMSFEIIEKSFPKSFQGRFSLETKIDLKEPVSKLNYCLLLFQDELMKCSTALFHLAVCL